MKKLVFAGLVVLAVAALSMAGCSKGVQSVDAQGVRDAQARGVTVVDIREPVEFANGHIPGAINVPMGTVETAMADWPRDAEFVIYCNTANRSGSLIPTLEAMGFTNILHYDTGIVTWDGEVEKGAGAAVSAPSAAVSLAGPALYEFYTDWCPGCTEMKPIVEKLAGEFKGSVAFNLYDVEKSAEGSALANKLGMAYVPSFVLVDSSGEIVESWAGTIEEADLRDKVAGLK